jgi:hypothetical protein
LKNEHTFFLLFVRVTLCFDLNESTLVSTLVPSSSSSDIRRTACWADATVLDTKRGEVENADTEVARPKRYIANVEIFMLAICGGYSPKYSSVQQCSIWK